MTLLRTATALAAVLVLAGCQTSPVPQKATSGFSQPILTPVLYGGEEKYQVSKAWTCYGETIPEGLLVDGASVPRPAWWFMPPDGVHRAAALYHDWAYINRGKLRNGTVLTRYQSDLAFYNLMIKGGITPARAGTAYNAVRGFGWQEWNKLYVGPTIIPVQSVVLAKKPQRKTFLTRHIYATQLVP